MQIDQLPSYVVTIAATNHSELLDRAVWRRFQLRLPMPQPTREALSAFLDSQFSLWPEETGIKAEVLAAKLGHVSFAEALEFCQTVRRQHILSLANRELKDIMHEQVELWKTRVTPNADAARTGQAASAAKQPKKRHASSIGQRRRTGKAV
jgi:AAA+ superfamily predicted ATPase